jgi:acetylornithine deacetylase/succinyl-diaminopimelate desuccinylase family protein
MTETEKLLRELIALPSVNPAFLGEGDSNGGEKRVAEFLAATAARGGLDVEFQTVSDDRANILARLAPRSKRRHRVVLAPHMDTVNAEPAQFQPRSEGGRVFGRGACDTKGSIAAMIIVLSELARGGERPAQTEVIFAGLVDEENAQTGSRALAATGMKADLAIVGEPTQLYAVTAHKGSLWLRLRTSGKSAHGARPELGRNAVHEMAKVVDYLQTDYAHKLKKRRHPLLGCATVSVGSICGGTQPNIVPDRCEITVDRRTVPGETEASVSREIKQLVAKRGIKVEMLKGKLLPCNPMETDPKLPFVQQFMSVVGQRKPLGVDYFCDGAVLAEAGIPSIVFGPGDIAHAHTVNEWIDTRSLEQGRAILARFLRSLP